MNTVFNHCLGAAVNSLYAMADEEGVDGSMCSIAKRALIGVAVFVLAKGAHHGLKRLVSYLESHPLIIREDQGDDEEVVFRAVSQCGYFLRDASPRLQDSYRIVITAIRNAPLALKYASFRLRSHSEVLREAMHRDGRSIAYVTVLMIDKPEIFLTAMRNHPQAFYSLPRNLQARIRELLLHHEIDIDDVIFFPRHQNTAALRMRMMQILEEAAQQKDLLVDEPDEKELLGQRETLRQRGIAPNGSIVGYTREYA